MSLADLNVGVLFLVAVSGTGVLVIFMAGWSSNNKYALFGAMRAVAMSISYEIPMVLALLTLVVFSGTMSINGIVEWQQQEDVIFILLFPLAAIAFFFSASAELNRTPADISEAESEIVAGYHTEYSGMRFGLFYAVELGNTMVISAFVATFFLGGWWLWGLEQWVPSWDDPAGQDRRGVLPADLDARHAAAAADRPTDELLLEGAGAVVVDLRRDRDRRAHAARYAGLGHDDRAADHGGHQHQPDAWRGGAVRARGASRTSAAGAADHAGSGPRGRPAGSPRGGPPTPLPPARAGTRTP